MDFIWISGLCILCLPLYSEAGPVYGFQGASSALVTGRTLHYAVHLKECEMLSGAKADPEFEETFGGHVTLWRSFNDRDISDVPFMVFYDQKMLFDEAGKLSQLVREVEVWDNDTAIVISVQYSTDYSKVISVNRHQCKLSSANTTGDIAFHASDTEPDRLHSFDEVLDALEGGRYVHFQAMTFICMGGREHSFSNFGGHIPNYEMKMEGGAVHGVRSSVQQTVHYDAKTDVHVRDVINLKMFDNRTVEIIDVRGRPLYEDLIHEHVSYCTLETGMPGGTFNAFAS